MLELIRFGAHDFHYTKWENGKRGEQSFDENFHGKESNRCSVALMFLLVRGKLFETHALAGLELYLMCGESLNVG